MKLLTILSLVLLSGCAEPTIIHWPSAANISPKVAQAITPAPKLVIAAPIIKPAASLASSLPTTAPKPIVAYMNVVSSPVDKADCLPTEAPPVIEMQTVMPTMVYFCTKFDVSDQLKCLNWEKSYKALICRGETCKVWTQQETASGTKVFSIKDE